MLQPAAGQAHVDKVEIPIHQAHVKLRDRRFSLVHQSITATHCRSGLFGIERDIELDVPDCRLRQVCVTEVALFELGDVAKRIPGGPEVVQHQRIVDDPRPAEDQDRGGDGGHKSGAAGQSRLAQPNLQLLVNAARPKQMGRDQEQ
jgi:hypothetical protein